MVWVPSLREMRWIYRLFQFRRQVTAHGVPNNAGLASEVLSGDALALFLQMAAGDQIHALCVLDELRRQGELRRQPFSPHVEQAALLHDVGKAGARLTVWHRGTATLLHAVAPEWLERLSTSDAHSWRHPFHVLLDHAVIGAQACQRAGCSPQIVAMVRYHETGVSQLEDAVDDPILRAEILALQKADDVC